MKAQFILSLLATAGFQAARAQDAVPDECGGLGVFQVDLATLPVGVDATQLRPCANHPLGLAKEAEAKAAAAQGLEGNISAKACATNTKGCEKGYCWRRCGTGGSWCWAAKNDGWGDWITCKSANDCTTSMACGQGECPACGCSC